MKQHIYYFTAILIFINVAAQDSLRTYILDEITVTDKRSINAVPTFLYKKSLLEINENHQLNTEPVLKIIDLYNPGIFVTSRSNLGYGVGSGSGGGINVRGIGSSPNTQVLLLVNGNPQFMGLMGHPLPDSYTSDEVKEVEVISGPASAIYGSGAMGGVVNLITGSEMDKGTSLSLSSSYGSFNTLQYSAKLGYSTRDFQSSFKYKNQSTDGHRSNSSFDLDSYSIDIEKPIGNIFALRLSSAVDDYKIYDPGTVSNPLPDSYADITRGIIELGLSNYFAKSDGRISLFYNFGEHEISDGFQSKDYNFGGRFFQNFELSEINTTSIGLDYTNFGGEAENVLMEADFGDHSISQFGMFINTSHSFSKIVQFSGTLRYDNNSQFGSIITPQAGFNFQLTRKLKTKFFVSKGYRNPTIRELYLFPFPTPDLKPENLWNYETGISYLFNESLETDVNLYYIEGDNLIQVTGVPPNLTYSNSGKFINKGLEANIKYDPFDFYNIKISASIIDPDKITASFPQQSFSAIIDFTFDKFYSLLLIEHNREIYGVNNFMQKLNDFTLVNIDWTYNVINNLVIGVKVENLLDEEYEILPGYPMPGISFYGSIKWKLNIDE